MSEVAGGCALRELWGERGRRQWAHVDCVPERAKRARTPKKMRRNTRVRGNRFGGTLTHVYKYVICVWG